MAEPLIIQDQKNKQEEIHVSQNAVEQKNVNAQTNVVGQVQGRQSLNSVRESLGGAFKEADLENLNVKKKEKKEKIVSAGPQYIGLDQKFGFRMKGDSDRMMAIRNAVFEYNLEKGRPGFKEMRYLMPIINACNAYTKGRFMLLKAGRVAGKRMSEVKQLRDQCKQKLREDYSSKDIELITNDPMQAAYISPSAVGGYLSFTEGVIEALLRLFIENLAIRLPLTLLMLPFWTVNKLVAKIRKAATGKETTQLKLPGFRGLRKIFGRIEARKKGHKSHKSFFDTWFKSPATMDRAKAEYEELVPTRDNPFIDDMDPAEA